MKTLILVLVSFISLTAIGSECRSPVRSKQIQALVEYAVQTTFEDVKDYTHPTVCSYSEDYDLIMIDAKVDVSFLGGRQAESCYIEVFNRDELWNMRKIYCDSGLRESFYFDHFDLLEILDEALNEEAEDYYEG